MRVLRSNRYATAPHMLMYACYNIAIYMYTLNITYHDRKTNTWVRAKTGVTDVIKTTRRMKWSWAGHISRLKDDRWTKCITTWKPYERKRLRGRPAKRWRDDLDEYWNETTWQRTAQDRQTWKQHAEAFAQPRDNTADI